MRRPTLFRRAGLVAAFTAVTVLLGAGTPDAPVATAAMDGDAAEVLSLLRQGADVNAAMGDGMTALHWAARHGNDELIGVLLYAGANPAAVTRIGHYTPLMMAAREGHAAAVTRLLEAGSNVQAVTETGVTALHLAAAAGQPGAVEALIAAGAEVNATEAAWEQTPIMWAANEGRTAVVRILTDAGADPSLSSKVVIIKELEEEDRELSRVRNERMAAIRAQRVAAATGLTEEEARERSGDVSDDFRGGVAEDEASEDEADEDEADEDEASEDEVADEADAEAESDDAESDDAESDEAEVEAADDEAEDEAETDEAEEAGEEAAAEPQPLSYGELVGGQGGLNALHHAVREGHAETVLALLDAGADVNAVTGGDHSSPLVLATINGHFDLGLELMARGADVNLASEAGVTPLFAAINLQWAPKALYPQPKAHEQQTTSYLDYMQALLEAGADPNVRVNRHIWFMSYNFDLLGVDTGGATPFWRAAYALDVDAMRLLVSYGADPAIPTRKAAERRFGRRRGPEEDQSGLDPVPVGGPGVFAIHAASGVGYGKDFAANSHRYVPDGWLPAVRYLVEELGADVNARDHEGFTPVHHAAARGDVELIEYLVEKGADVTLIARRGQTTADMANGPVQRVQPFPEAIALLESLGSANNNNCLSC